MIIDIILDRKADNESGEDSYRARYLYDYCVNSYSIGFCTENSVAIARALDDGEEEDVQDALCRYLDDNEYTNPEIKEYVKSVRWIVF